MRSVVVRGRGSRVMSNLYPVGRSVRASEKARRSRREPATPNSLSGYKTHGIGHGIPPHGTTSLLRTQQSTYRVAVGTQKKQGSPLSASHGSWSCRSALTSVRRKSQNTQPEDVLVRSSSIIHARGIPQEEKLPIGTVESSVDIAGQVHRTVQGLRLTSEVSMI